MYNKGLDVLPSRSEFKRGTRDCIKANKRLDDVALTLTTTVNSFSRIVFHLRNAPSQSD